MPLLPSPGLLALLHLFVFDTDGNGGNGCVSFKAGRNLPKLGADGGNGFATHVDRYDRHIEE